METVTISLETYNNMNKELKVLREQVKEKEIIIHEPFDYNKIVSIIIFSTMVLGMFIFGFLLLTR